MLAGIPAFFDIAPNAAYITAAKANEISGFALVHAFSLQGIKMLHYRQGNAGAVFRRSNNAIVYTVFFHTIHNSLRRKPGRYFSSGRQWSWAQRHLVPA